MLRKTYGRKITLTFRVFLGFILFGICSEFIYLHFKSTGLFDGMESQTARIYHLVHDEREDDDWPVAPKKADAKAISEAYGTFSAVIAGMKHGALYNVSYNDSKKKAVISLNDGSAVYIDFETQKTLKLMDGWINNFVGTWLSETVAVVEGSCGTGCAQGLLFIAPDKVVTCSAYNRENDDYIEDNPKSRTNRPLIVDPEREIYVCYDADNKIQVFPFPKVATIMPPKGYAPEQAEIIDDQLHITYENQERESVVQVFSLK